MRAADHEIAGNDAPKLGKVRAGFTVCELAARFRVSPDKVRLWINRGELTAINTAASRCGKPRWVVTPEALADFEKKRQCAVPTTKLARRKRPKDQIDFYPDSGEMTR